MEDTYKSNREIKLFLMKSFKMIILLDFCARRTWKSPSSPLLLKLNKGMGPGTITIPNFFLEYEADNYQKLKQYSVSEYDRVFLN